MIITEATADLHLRTIAAVVTLVHDLTVLVGTNKVDVIAFFLVRGGREIFYLTELPTPVTGTGHFGF
jgi:hypothetical protein